MNSRKILQPVIFSFDEIIDRIKAHYSIKKDADVARLLDTPPQKFHVWRQRGFVPLELIVALCLQDDLKIDYILLGIGSPGTSFAVPKVVSDFNSLVLHRDLIELIIAKTRLLEADSKNQDIIKEIELLKRISKFITDK